MRLLTTLLHAPALKPHWRLLLCLLIAVTCGFAFAPHAPGLDIENGDKLQHILAFSSLAVCAVLASPVERPTILRVLVGLLGFGIFIELVQLFIPSRSADWKDVVADMVGAGVGVLAIHAARRLLPARRSSAG